MAEVRMELKPEELKERSRGQNLFAMTQTPGFNELKEHLEEMAFHSWVDPRETPNKEEFLWRELNGFHGANLAKELLEWIQQCISKAEYLEKKRRGEINSHPFSIG
jgi:hypothetical protein